MIKNIFYSLFLHYVIFLIVYFNFNFSPPIEIEKSDKVVVSFVIRSGNSNNVSKPTKTIATPPKEPLEQDNPEEKIIEEPKEIPTPPKPKTNPKKQPKVDPKSFKPKAKNPKTETNAIQTPDQSPDAKQEPEEPKEQEKIPEVKEEIKDDAIKNKNEETTPNKDKQQMDEKIAEVVNQYDSTENTIENLDLLVREKFNIQTQIKYCYKKALDESEAKSRAVVDVHISVDKDGSIDLNKIIIKDLKKYNTSPESEFYQAVEVVRQALRFCSPIRNLPQDKYEVWKEIDLRFDGE